MSKIIPGNQKHTTLDNRIFIKKGLEQHHVLRSFALGLGKDFTTISKEIRKHTVKNHEYIRKIYLKEHLFDNDSQENNRLMISRKQYSDNVKKTLYFFEA